MSKKIISIIALTVFTTGCLYTNQSMGNVPIIEAGSVSDDNYIDQYNSVVNAYIDLERSGYTSYDESILGDDVCLIPNGSGSYFIGYETKPSLMYAFYDLNGNGLPELLIGAEMGAADETVLPSVFITGIYGLNDGKPVSLIQIGAWSQLNILTVNSNNCILKIISGTHIDYVEEYFYKIDKNDTLLMLDKLYTYGRFDQYDMVDDITYSHTREVNGEEVSITEQEYLGLMQKYGSVGALNDVGEIKANEIVINSWKYLAAYE